MATARKSAFFLLWVSILLAVSAVVMTQCGKVTRKWSEEVVLDDGRAITIDRYVAFRETSSWAGDAYDKTETRSVISFRDGLSKLPDWDVPLVPILLYQDSGNGDWVIVATTSSCEAWSSRGTPKPPYWEYRLKSRDWQQSSLSSKTFGRKSNLLFTFDAGVTATHVTEKTKSSIRNDTRIALKYRVITESQKTNCG